MKTAHLLIGVTLAASLLPLAYTASALQPDAPFLALKEKRGAAWSAEDKQIDDKLAALRKKFGKRPNIIYILTDDIGWGELGWQGGGKHRGTPSAQLDKLAYEGMRFWSAYSEPSCTPSRVAINTGRHPARTGLTAVLWPGAQEGLAAEEVTIAQVLSDAGYHTAMWGKWHMGELPEHSPENHGYDYSYYGLFNGAADGWPMASEFYANNMPQPTTPAWFDFPGNEKYKEMTGIDLSVSGYVGEKGKGRKPIEGLAGILGEKRQEAFEKESIKQITAYFSDKAKSDKPFFIYWASYAQQVSGSQEYRNEPFVDHANAQSSFMAMHNAHIRQLLDTLKEQGIAENTLVVWWSDNGPMYAFYPTSGYSWLKGGKGAVTEGGVRVPAMARWPGMIKAGQDPVDMIHLTDLYTTAARLGGAMDKIPSDRVVDGVDQTALLLLGEGHSRRDYMFLYSGSKLGAVRWMDIKAVIEGAGHGGLPGITMCNIVRDPGEKFCSMYPYLWTVSPFQSLVKSHMALIERFPNRKPGLPEEAGLTPHD
ncbi:MAG TPA: sulfatase-like hydrolase/transferase [Candidatus Defluviicoccus seviourii]|nr:sulfatase-like hydrolase/transferase [Candidatus Defluviicoccus seviourii]